ncbi:hypothetical protein KUF54_10060 [Comamonas sp. Y33R10-2]|uniref:ESPR domain-containing protein n=1 Tax=Comamonas sp. Y33R10-2 TaxID=2853257 RepID=UPI001C5C9DFC|nr:ESPR domain-containing protein [Comamonas sp. Y33R10-2]QXZ08446.1 hypothetical protein KUF54_10060 [Comamonas sp. Y33R10-2]
MNRSYRTIWNESLGAWVAASEISKARGKRSASAVSLAVVSLLLMYSPATFATYTAGGGRPHQQRALLLALMF